MNNTNAIEKVKMMAEEQEKISKQEIVVKKSVGQEVKTGLRDNWKYRIVVPEKVPAKYCEPSERKIKEAMKVNIEAVKKGEFVIPGIEFYNEPSVYTRGTE